MTKIELDYFNRFTIKLYNISFTMVFIKVTHDALENFTLREFRDQD